jgi:hypothetical protein
MTTQKQEQENIPPGLQLYWYEIKDGEEASTWWGQLAGSTHRMQVVVDGLDSTCNESDISVALTRLEYHVENYFIRAYELRERVLGLLSELTGQKKTVDELRHPARRQDAFASLQPSASPLIESVTQILSFLDDDIGLRNMHTHRTFLSLGLSTGYDVYDPHDALLDLERDHEARRRFEELLHNEVKRVAEQYMDKVKALTEMTWVFLQKADNLIRRSSPKV